MAGYWPSSFFFCVSFDRDEVEVSKNAKKRTRPIFSHSLVNKGYRQKESFYMWEPIRMQDSLHLAHSRIRLTEKTWGRWLSCFGCENNNGGHFTRSKSKNQAK